MKVRIRDKSCNSNPVKMLNKKKKFFKYKCIIALSASLNVILAAYLIVNN